MNRLSFFGTPLNYRLTRAEYLVAFAFSAALFIVHIQDVRWGPALLLFAYIDIIGYLPGLFVRWRFQTTCVEKVPARCDHRRVRLPIPG